MKKPTDPVTKLWNCVHCGAINSGELKNCKNCNKSKYEILKKTNSWNYRVMKQEIMDGDVYLQIHEVFYDKVGRKSWSVNGVTVAGETIEELRDILNKMLKSLDSKILDYDG